MSEILTKLNNFLEKEILSVWIITLSLAINVVAWVIPHGSLQHPDRDPTGIIKAMKQIIVNGEQLHYLWHALLSITLGLIAYSVYKIWTLSMLRIVDRCDL